MASLMATVTACWAVLRLVEPRIGLLPWEGMALAGMALVMELVGLALLAKAIGMAHQ